MKWMLLILALGSQLSCANKSQMRHACGIPFTSYLAVPFQEYRTCLIKKGIPAAEINSGSVLVTFDLVYEADISARTLIKSVTFSNPDQKTIGCNVVAKIRAEEEYRSVLGDKYSACLQKTKGSTISISGTAYPVKYSGKIKSPNALGLIADGIPISGVINLNSDDR